MGAVRPYIQYPYGHFVTTYALRLELKVDSLPCDSPSLWHPERTIIYRTE